MSNYDRRQRDATRSGEIRRSLFAVVLACTGLASPVWGQAGTLSPWNGRPVVVQVRVAALDRLLGDVEFLSEGVAGQEPAALREWIATLASGIDTARPAGWVLIRDQSLVPVAFLPLQDEERLFTTLRSRFGWEFVLGDDGIYRALTGQTVARAANGWLYLTTSEFRTWLAEVPADPASRFAGSDPAVTFEATAALAALSPADRTAFQQLLTPSLGVANSSPQSTLVASLVHWAVAESTEGHLELQCFRPLKQLHASMTLTPQAGSSFEAWLNAAESRPMAMEHLLERDAPASVVVSTALRKGAQDQLLLLWRPVDAAARQQLPAANAVDPTARLLARLGITALDALSATITRGELDLGLVLQSRGNEIALLAGSNLVGAQHVREAVDDAHLALQQAPDFQSLQWKSRELENVALHAFQVPTEPSSREWVGPSLQLAAGLGEDSVYAAAGGAFSVQGLEATIVRRSVLEPTQGEALKVLLRMAPLLALLDRVPGTDSEANARVHALAQAVAHYRKNDTLELTVGAGDGTLAGRLRIDLGVVRALVSTLPETSDTATSPATVANSPVEMKPRDLALRLSPGDQFQIQFDTDTKVTSTVDGKQRTEIAHHSALYEFRVLDPQSPRTIRLDTRQLRAVIRKSGPDGDTSFDTAHSDQVKPNSLETMLYAAMVNEPFQFTVEPDGSLSGFAGIPEAVLHMVDEKLVPPPEERAQAIQVVEQSFNERALRDLLGRAFEYLPGESVSAGRTWTRTAENYSGINFGLENRFQLQQLTPEEALISVRGRVQEKDPDPAAPVAWTVLGKQIGSIRVDSSTGMLRLAEYDLELDAEATTQMNGIMQVQPVTSVFRMVIGPPQRVAERIGPSTSAPPRASSTPPQTLPGPPRGRTPDGVSSAPQPQLFPQTIAGKRFRMFWHQGEHRGVVADVTLNPDETITGSSTGNQVYWELDRAGNLKFLREDETTTTTFDQNRYVDGRWFLTGSFHLNRDVTHSLEEALPLPSMLDDESLNRLVRPWSRQQFVSLNPGESHTYQLADGTTRVVQLEQVKETRDSVLGFVRQANVIVRVNETPLGLECAPYVMPTEIDGLRIQADITSGMLPELPKQVSFSLWDARDPIVDPDAFRFPLQDYRLFSHALQSYGEIVWLGLHDGDPQGTTARHSYGIDLAGFDGEVAVTAATDGVVLDLYPDTKNPYAVLLESAEGAVWEYGHLQSVGPAIREGTAVRRGQVLGLLGKRGRSGNFSHLHLGLHPSRAHRTSVIRTQQLNFFPWIVSAYRAQHPEALFAFAGGHKVVRVGETCAFDPSRSVTFSSTIRTSRWVFPDGEVVERPSSLMAWKTFSQPGTYAVELWIEDAEGRRDVDFCQVKVFPRDMSLPGLPTVFMSHSPTAGIAAGQPVKFRCWVQSEQPTTLQISFGDGTSPVTSASQAEVNHTFSEPGLYVVTASTTVNGLPVMQKQKVLVAPLR